MAVSNTKSMFSLFGGVISYLGSEWSFAQCRFKDQHSICAIKDETLIAVSLEGNHYTAKIDTGKGGECTDIS